MSAVSMRDRRVDPTGKSIGEMGAQVLAKDSYRTHAQKLFLHPRNSSSVFTAANFGRSKCSLHNRRARQFTHTYSAGNELWTRDFNSQSLSLTRTAIERPFT
jgi:hypothetical protein